jgi:hypothetical protein
LARCRKKLIFFFLFFLLKTVPKMPF